MITLQQLKDMESDTIFATGVTPDNAAGANITGSGQKLRWVACRGGGWDWAIYIHKESWTPEEIQRSGDKIYNRGIIKKLVPCDEEALGVYRD